MPLNSNYNLVIQCLVAAVIVLGTVIAMFPPQGAFFRWWEEHTQAVMLGFLALGLVFFVFNFKKLMIVSFGACTALCLLLDARLEAPLKNAEQTGEQMVAIGQFSLGHTDRDQLDAELATMLHTQADVIAVQKIPRELLAHVREVFTCCGYPYFESAVDSVRNLAVSIFSRHSFEYIRHIEVPNAPSIAGRIKLPMLNEEQREFYFFNSCINSTEEGDYAENKENLQLFSMELSRIQAPLFVFGDYRLVSWSRDLQAFREFSNLNESRRGIMPTPPHGYISIFDRPYDHIFYSDHFECINFETISSASTVHLGIVGTYQFQSQERRNDAKQTSQEF